MLSSLLTYRTPQPVNSLVLREKQNYPPVLTRTSPKYVFFTIVLLIAVQRGVSQDTIRKKASVQTSSAIKSKVSYNALDSVRFDVVNQRVYLFKEAQVKYEDMVLKAEYIEFDLKQNVAYARGGRDSLGRITLDSAGYPVGDPVFTEGDKSFEAKEMTYNFETKKGKIKNVTTQEGEGFIHARDAKKDTGDVYYVKNGKYTTCNLEHPHFYLNASKLKIIPDDRIICGPAYLAIEDAPTPLGIPFGVFPNKRGRKNGILIPTYGESNLGFFLRDGGVYFGLSDYVDLALRGDIYSLGSYGAKAHSNYAWRYRFTGNFGIDFSRIKIGEKGEPDFSDSKTFFIRWLHTQDPKLNPSVRFSANVNLGSALHQTYNASTGDQYLTNTHNSNVGWTKTWRNSPFSMAVNMAHDQNNISRIVNVTLPELSLAMNRIYPLKRKDPSRRPNLFNKIGIGATVTGKNMVTERDTLFFHDSVPPIWTKFRNGMRASVPLSTSTNLGPIITSFSANLNAYGYFERTRKFWVAADSTVVTDTLKGFSVPWDVNYSVSASTKYYMIYQYKSRNKRGPAVRAIRHVLTPAVSLSLRPDYGLEKYHYYQMLVTGLGDSLTYSAYQNAIYGGPPSGEAGFLNFNLNNNLEMKIRPARKDSSGPDRKFVVLESFGLSGSYNLPVDSFKLSVINLYARTRVASFMDISLTGILDPYVFDTAANRKLPVYQWEFDKKPGRLTSAALALTISLRKLAKKDKGPKAAASKSRMTQKDLDMYDYIMRHPNYYVDFNVPWNLYINYNVIYSNPNRQDTLLQTFTFSGDVNVTKKWKVGFMSGFDFRNQDFTYTSFNIYRDLHCWEMTLNWIPFGFRKSYMLTVAVKASVLQDLKLNRKRDWYDYN